MLIISLKGLQEEPELRKGKLLHQQQQRASSGHKQLILNAVREVPETGGQSLG